MTSLVCPWCLAALVALELPATCPRCLHRADLDRYSCTCPSCYRFGRTHDAPTPLEIVLPAARPEAEPCR